MSESARKEIEAAILTRLEAKSQHEYQWPRWAAAEEASRAVMEYLDGEATKARDARVQAFFDSAPEPEGSIDEVLEQAHRQTAEHMQAKWGVGVYRFGCPFCGASSRELCISENTSEDMESPHGERVRFAAVHDRSLQSDP